MALGAAVIWSVNFALIRYMRLDAGLEPIPFALLRFDIAALAAGALMLAKRPRLAGLGRRGWATLVLLAILVGPIFQIMLATGARTTSSGIMGMIMGAQPLHIAWLGLVLLGERVRPAQWAAILLAYVGVALPLAMGESLDLRDGLAGPGLVFIASLFASMNGVLPRGLRHRLSPRDMLMTLMVLSALISLPLMSAEVIGQWSGLGVDGWAAMAYLGLPGQLGAIGLWYAALWRLRAATVAYYLLVLMMLSAGWGWLIHDEPLTAWHAVGLAFVGGGLILNTRAGRHARRHERSIVE